MIDDELYDDMILAGEFRAKISVARDNGVPVDKDISFWLAIADLLEIPDDLPLWPAVSAAAVVPTRLDIPASVAYTKSVAHAAGRAALADASKQ
jgi:hypothetical protein